MKKRKLFCSLVQTLNGWHKINILFVQSSKIIPNRPFIGRICYCWTDWIRIIQISNKNRFFFIKLCLHATNFAMDGIKEYIHATTMGKSTLIAFSLKSKCVFFSSSLYIIDIHLIYLQRMYDEQRLNIRVAQTQQQQQQINEESRIQVTNASFFFNFVTKINTEI